MWKIYLEINQIPLNLNFYILNDDSLDKMILIPPLPTVAYKDLRFILVFTIQFVFQFNSLLS